MCNQAGFNGKKVNINKLRLLSIFGRDRGKDSCGILYNGQLYHGVWESAYKDYGDSLKWMEVFKFPEQHDGSSVIMHNRAKTMGHATKENAHPFEFEDGEDKFFFQHNGKFDDVPKLASLVELDPKHYTVDSKFLGYGILTKGYDVLRDYEGNASCMWTWKNSPKTLYVWKGAHYTTSTKTILTEERPLFYYYDEEDQGFYFNSVKTPLEVISNFNAEILEVPSNAVLCFVDGKLVSETKVDRQVVISNTSYDYGYEGYYRGNSHNNSNYVSYSSKELDPWKHRQGLLYSHIYYYDGFYMYKNDFANGIYNVTKDGYATINNSVGYTAGGIYEKLFFHDGLWIKDEKCYNKILSEGGRNPYFSELYPMSLAVDKEGLFRLGGSYSGKLTGGRTLKLRFFQYYLTFKFSKVAGCSITYTKQKNEESLLATFNKTWNTKCWNLAECENINILATGNFVDWKEYELQVQQNQEQITKLLATSTKKTLEMISQAVRDDFKMLVTGISKYLEDFLPYADELAEYQEFSEAYDMLQTINQMSEEYLSEHVNITSNETNFNDLPFTEDVDEKSLINFEAHD